MSGNPNCPWASGPAEILLHGLQLLENDSDVNRRLAMISIDNAVELMMKTYLGLPKRVTGIRLPRKQYQELCESFPQMLDAMGTFAADRLDAVDLGVIEWYHRLRNQLYHQGNGLTVERDKVELYAELAKQFYSNLYGVTLVGESSDHARLVGEFLEAWASLERSLRAATRLRGEDPKSLHDSMRLLQNASVMAHEDRVEISNLYWLRNRIVHGEDEYRAQLTPQMVAAIRSFGQRYSL